MRVQGAAPAATTREKRRNNKEKKKRKSGPSQFVTFLYVCVCVPNNMEM